VERRKASIPIARNAPPTQSSMRRLRKLVCSRQLVRLSALRSPRGQRENWKTANPAPQRIRAAERSVGLFRRHAREGGHPVNTAEF
jgi:hypothetical protein